MNIQGDDRYLSLKTGGTGAIARGVLRRSRASRPIGHPPTRDGGERIGTRNRRRLLRGELCRRSTELEISLWRRASLPTNRTGCDAVAGLSRASGGYRHAGQMWRSVFSGGNASSGGAATQGPGAWAIGQAGLSVLAGMVDFWRQWVSRPGCEELERRRGTVPARAWRDWTRGGRHRWRTEES